jgi:hypothetical protein
MRISAEDPSMLGQVVRWVGGIGLAMVAVLFYLDEVDYPHVPEWVVVSVVCLSAGILLASDIVARKYNAELIRPTVQASKVLLLGSAFDEAAIYTSFWAHVLLFLNWSLSLSGLLWIGMPLATFLLVDILRSGDQTPTIVYLVHMLIAIFVSLGARWVANYFLPGFRHSSSYVPKDLYLNVIPISVCAYLLFHLPRPYFGVGSLASASANFKFAILPVGIAAWLSLALSVALSAALALVAATQFGVGLPFSILFTRRVFVEKTVPGVDSYVGFSPRNDVALRHSRLLAWPPCQRVVLDFIKLRLNEDRGRSPQREMKI